MVDQHAARRPGTSHLRLLVRSRADLGALVDEDAADDAASLIGAHRARSVAAAPQLSESASATWSPGQGEAGRRPTARLRSARGAGPRTASDSGEAPLRLRLRVLASRAAGVRVRHDRVCAELN
eukprot:scaffold6268_cov56-Phaeocystis_antarctica.AAC.1